MAQLPAYHVDNAMINFQPLSQAVDTYREGMDVAAKSNIMKNYANAMAEGRTQDAQGFISQLDPKLGMEAGLYPGKVESQQNELRMQTAKLLGGHAQTILDMKDPGERQAAAENWINSDPKFAQGLTKMGIANWQTDPVAAVRAIHGEALGAQDPEKRALMQAEAAKAGTMQVEPGNKVVNINPNAPVGPAGQTIVQGDLSMKTPGERAQVAQNAGLKPGTVEYNAVVVNGKLPDVVPDHKNIEASDDKVRAAQKLVDDLRLAKDYSSKAYSGGLADKRAAVMNMTDLTSTEGSKATAQFQNIIQNSVLPTLKGTFGARVTNADLKLAMDLQASANQPESVRNEVIDRAVKRAHEIATEQLKASQQLRQGTYFKPGGGPQPRQKAISEMSVEELGTLSPQSMSPEDLKAAADRFDALSKAR
jgi:hypothetical protein